MTNKFDEMREAIQEAEHTMRAADKMAAGCARILAGRLRKVPPFLLDPLKRELRNYNMNTHEWKD